MKMFAMPITPIPGKVMCAHDCSDEAAGLDIRGGMIVISLQHAECY